MLATLIKPRFLFTLLLVLEITVSSLSHYFMLRIVISRPMLLTPDSWWQLRATKMLLTPIRAIIFGDFDFENFQCLLVWQPDVIFITIGPALPA